jgi:hypothetical protein
VNLIKNPILVHYAFAIIGIIALASFWPEYFDFIELRNGTKLEDHLLYLLPAADISTYIFIILYGSLVIGFVSVYNQPLIILGILYTYIAVTALRILSIYLLPLEPPIGYQPLLDPFVAMFTTDGKIVSKDLFFSGHISTVCAMYYWVPNGMVKKFLTILITLLAIGLLIQHVHYTIDILAGIILTALVALGVRHLLRFALLKK